MVVKCNQMFSVHIFKNRILLLTLYFRKADTLYPSFGVRIVFCTQTDSLAA